MTEIEQRLATLEAAVRRLSDIEEIRALRLRYHEYVRRRAAEARRRPSWCARRRPLT